MKKVTLQRDIMVPDSHYCIQWINQKITCPMLSFRKDAKNPKIVWKCNFFDEDLVQNINSIGIRKFCEEMPEYIDNVVNLAGESYIA